ncbi:MAG: class I SAM-dependent methyltransferase [Acidobacteriota bacterium]
MGNGSGSGARGNLYNVPVDDITRSDLETMALAVNYRRWVYAKMEPYLGGTILEIGGGIGNYTEMFPDSSRVVTIEPHLECVEVLSRKFAGSERVEVVQAGIEEYQPCGTFETVVCLNVLEHIEDDRAALRKLAETLGPGGHLVLMLPACRTLYGPIDRALHHHRRYARGEAGPLVRESGLRPVRIQYMNLVGFFGWLANARLLRKREQSKSQVRFFDRVVVPVMRRVEAVLPPPIGQSLFVVASTGHASS